MSGPLRLRAGSRLAFVWLSVVVLIAGSLAAAAFNEHLYRVQTRREAGVEAKVLADTVTAALSFGDRAALQEYVDALRDNPEVDAVGVFDEQGDRVASYTRSHIAARLSETVSQAQARERAIVYVPVTQGGTRLGAVYLRYIAEPLVRRLSRYAAPGLLVLMAALLVIVTTFDARAMGRANDALLTQIAEREKVEAALRQSQKLEAIGRLTGGIAHDFNNMLAIVLGSLDLMLRRHGDADPRIVRLAEAAREGATRAAALTQRLLAFSRRQPLKPAPTDVAKVVADFADLLRRTLGEGIAIETVAAGGLWRALIDVAQLETAILNLAINARDAMPDGGKLTVEVANTYIDRAYAERDPDATPGQYVAVAMSDTGGGIAPDVLAQVFEPFFTTKPVGLGTGLGLSQVHGFIKQSGGHVRIYSEVGVGTVVKLYLPRSPAEADLPAPVTARPSKGSRRNVTVLVVEDEPGVRAFVVDALVELGYDVVAADGPGMALKQLDVHPAVSLLLTDVVMPEMNGRHLADEALRRRPALRVVFMTGYTQNAIVHNGVLDAGAHLLTKPFTISELEAELGADLV